MSLESLKKEVECYFPEAQLLIWQNSNWSQNSESYRLKIREFAQGLISPTQTHSSVLDLSRPLTSAILKGIPSYFSISHSTNSGVLAQSSIPVGIDLELQSRVQEKVVARVSSTHELAAAPSPSFLWAAKESCFKALFHFKQPQTVSQLETSSWWLSPSGIWHFDLQSKNEFAVHNSKGFVFSHHSEVLAVFLATP